MKSDMRKLSRRECVALLGAQAAAALLASCAGRRGPGESGDRPLVSSRFTRAFATPPVLAPTAVDIDADYYDLVAQPGVAEIMPGRRTDIWSYNGSFPGPTIVARRNRQSIVRVRNALPTPTAIHLHGGNTAPDSDGFPTDMIMPGERRTYTYANRSRAATLWYHDHVMGQTGRDVYMGLAGLYLLRDEEEESLGLPSGAHELPVILQQRRFSEHGAFAYHEGDRIGVGGDVTLVNGVPWPRLEVEARPYRLRFVNASNATRYLLRLSSGTPLILIGVDGGLLAAPVPCAAIPLAMGERADVIVDFSAFGAGTVVDLVTGDLQDAGESLVRCVVGRRMGEMTVLPSHLSEVEVLSPTMAVGKRTFSFGASVARAFPPVSWTINGRGFDPNVALASARLGECELWTLQNHLGLGFAGMFHTVHLHLSPFQLLSRNGGPPAPHERGWKDTVALERGERIDILTRFEGFRGKYLMHCHNLEHEDHDMMARIDIV